MDDSGDEARGLYSRFNPEDASIFQLAAGDAGEDLPHLSWMRFLSGLGTASARIDAIVEQVLVYGEGCDDIYGG